MLRFAAYLGFHRQCEEAFRFYQRVIGGEITHMVKNGESPYADHFPPDFREAVMHARLVVGDAVLMGGDAPPGSTDKVSGFSVNLWLDDVAEAERIFAALSEGGDVQMPMAESFWAVRFGMCTDRFGIPWMVNVERVPAAV